MAEEIVDVVHRIIYRSFGVCVEVFLKSTNH